MLCWPVSFLLLALKVELGLTGLLSRSGVCPHPTANFVVKDTRLNFYGFSYYLPGEENPPCNIHECQYDTDCHGNTMCCSNHCGAFVCTESQREQRPCQYFTCPITKVCKIQKIKCIEPVCPEMMSIARPMCINGGPVYEMGKKKKRSRIPKKSLQSEAPAWDSDYNMYNTFNSWIDFFGRKRR